MTNILTKYLYLIPICIAIIIIVILILKSTTIKKISILKTADIIGKVFSPSNHIRLFYRKNILRFHEISFEKLIKFKIIILLSGLLFISLIVATDITYETYKIKHSPDYKASFMNINIIVNKGTLFELEMKYLDETISLFANRNIKEITLEDFEHLFKLKILSKEGINKLDEDEVVKRLYIRVKEYYKIRNINIGTYLFILFMLTIVPEFILLIWNTINKAERKNELIFLKRLMIMCGSIKPVVFQDVMDLLVEKSTQFKKVLYEINKSINKNSNNSEELYKYYIERTNDLDEKLFFEKLYMANSNDFRLAIENIKNEFKISQKENERRTKKQVELIHIMGVLGIMMLIFIWVLFLISPWMERFDLEGLM